MGGTERIGSYKCTLRYPKAKVIPVMFLLYLAKNILGMTLMLLVISELTITS